MSHPFFHLSFSLLQILSIILKLHFPSCGFSPEKKMLTVLPSQANIGNIHFLLIRFHFINIQQDHECLSHTFPNINQESIIN